MFARSRLRRWTGCQSGASAVEFAICLPLLISLLLGVFEFGWTQHCLSSVRFSLEKAGRHLALNPQASEQELEDLVTAHLADLAEDLTSVTLRRETRGPTGETGVLTAIYQREVGIPGLATFPVNYETSIETPISQFDTP